MKRENGLEEQYHINRCNLRKVHFREHNNQSRGYTIIVFELISLVSDSLDLRSHIGCEKEKNK